ncbi:MAG: hypothetical protein MSC30_01060 [Gaiellaceae bacterium MAG52_C11]|nr:hypothetical protein [Candidatus Gaiellasilicea maunaloa]
MTIPARTLKPYRHAVQAAALIALVLLALLAVGPAAAAESCGKKVVDDWYADGRVDGTYPPHCYDDAIEILPRDIKEYSSAPDDIERALQNRLNDKPAPPATTDPSPSDETPVPTTPPTSTSPRTTPDDEGEDVPPGDSTPSGGPSSPESGPPLDTADADAVPIPLLVLGGLALLLVAAGSAGYVTRRLQARRLPPPDA